MAQVVPKVFDYQTVPKQRFNARGASFLNIGATVRGKEETKWDVAGIASAILRLDLERSI